MIWTIEWGGDPLFGYDFDAVRYGMCDAIEDFLEEIENWESTPECERCEERAATHQVLMREEMLSDDRGIVWGYADVWLCDQCDREDEPDWDAIREEREERRTFDLPE